MFPDKTLEWAKYPSIIDGIGQPYVSDRGADQGILYLLVEEAESRRTYGVTIPYLAYAAFDEFLYTCAGHDSDGGHSIGSDYIKVNRSSQLIAAWQSTGVVRDLRHFLFVGGGDCIEVLSDGEPSITMLSNHEAGAWGPAYEKDKAGSVLH